jgi:hypothetical protein
MRMEKVFQTADGSVFKTDKEAYEHTIRNKQNTVFWRTVTNNGAYGQHTSATLYVCGKRPVCIGHYGYGMDYMGRDYDKGLIMAAELASTLGFTLEQTREVI